MVKRPVNHCLELTGEDAVEFDRYMNDPDDITPEGRELLRKAREDAKKMSLDEL
jgi:hypothetical protein